MEARDYILKAQTDRMNHITNSFSNADELLKAEGSRGGNVIGHTKSGKPIYENKAAHNPVYANFTKQDHSDAEQAHNKNNAATSDTQKKHAARLMATPHTPESQAFADKYSGTSTQHAHLMTNAKEKKEFNKNNKDLNNSANKSWGHFKAAKKVAN